MMKEEATAQFHNDVMELGCFLYFKSRDLQNLPSIFCKQLCYSHMVKLDDIVWILRNRRTKMCFLIFFWRHTELRLK